MKINHQNQTKAAVIMTLIIVMGGILVTGQLGLFIISPFIFLFVHGVTLFIVEEVETKKHQKDLADQKTYM